MNLAQFIIWLRKYKMIDNKTSVTIELELQKFGIIIGALQELPYKISAELIVEIQEKVNQFLKDTENSA